MVPDDGTTQFGAGTTRTAVASGTRLSAANSTVCSLTGVCMVGVLHASQDFIYLVNFLHHLCEVDRDVVTHSC